MGFYNWLEDKSIRIDDWIEDKTYAWQYLPFKDALLDFVLRLIPTTRADILANLVWDIYTHGSNAYDKDVSWADTPYLKFILPIIKGNNLIEVESYIKLYNGYKYFWMPKKHGFRE